MRINVGANCVRPQNVKHPMKHHGRTHGYAPTIGHFYIRYIISIRRRMPTPQLRITHYELRIKNNIPCAQIGDVETPSPTFAFVN